MKPVPAFIEVNYFALKKYLEIKLKKIWPVAGPPLAFVVKTLGVVLLTKAKKQSHHKD